MEEEQMSLTPEAIIHVMMGQVVERLKNAAADAANTATFGPSDQQQQMDTPWQPTGGWGQEEDIRAEQGLWRIMHGKQQESEAAKAEARACAQREKAARMTEVEAAMAARKAEKIAAGRVV
jgi:hypothetical protein